MRHTFLAAVLFATFCPAIAQAQGEIAPNDFTIATVPTGEGRDADQSGVAFSTTSDVYLVVYRRDLPTLVNHDEVYASVVSSAGAVVSGPHRISYTLPDNDAAYDGNFPAVAWSSVQNRFFVTWIGGLGGGTPEKQIWGVPVSTAGLTLSAQVQLSNVTPPPNWGSVGEVKLAYNSTNDEFMVAMNATDYLGESEIYIRRATGAGAAIGASWSRITHQGTDGDINYSANFCDVAWNSSSNQYLLVWQGTYAFTAPNLREDEAFGQRLDNVGALVGGVVRLSDVGVDGDASLDALVPTVAYNSADNEYLVVWQADDDQDGGGNSEYEIWGQRVSAAGAELGTNDFRISDMGGIGGGATYLASGPRIAYDAFASRYMIVWQGNNNLPGMATNEVEIWGQVLTGAGAAVGPNDFRLTDIGTDNTTTNLASVPRLTYNGTAHQFLVTFNADETLAGEFYVTGQLYDAETASTPTPTITPSSTRTPSFSHTQTSTMTPTITTSSSSTRTTTPTISPTFTVTTSHSATPSSTLTTTHSNTTTPTQTSTITVSFSSTATPSATATVTPSSSDTATATQTSTRTATPSVTTSSSDTATATHTSTSTSTPTATPTYTGTATSTATPTITTSSSDTATATHTSTSTATPTATPSFSHTSTATPSFSSTATPSATSTATPTFTASTTPSATPTCSPTSTISPTFTETPAYQRSLLGKSVLAPVPAKKGTAVCLYFDRAPRSSRWEVFGVDQRRLATLEFGADPRQCWDTKGFASGVYYIQVKVENKDGSQEAWMQKAMLVP